MADTKLHKLLQNDLTESVATALAEDVGRGDLTAELIPAGQQARAIVVSRQACMLCGQPWFDDVFRQLDTKVACDWLNAEGEQVAPDAVICELQGPARALLTGERSALNFLQLLSATATTARTYVDAVAGAGAIILDTRKTLPGLRHAQKYAVRCGGAQNHRIGLYDAILIKENHIAAAGSIQAAVTAASIQAPNVLIEVEVETLEQMRQALPSGAHRLLLDNFSINDLAEAVTLRHEQATDVTLEASGGITLDNVRAAAETGVDYISIGALTKDVVAVDFSMQFK
ncbi:MAG: carboxylating nicotinate-nucleotide diphosphorylase [Gammaproteobacteria bacterium]